MSAPIRIGISSCLLGQRVRYDANHKLDTYITGTLGRHFEFVPVCPEVAIGLGVPRPPIRLVGDPAAPRALGVKDPSLDVTDGLAAYGHRQAERLGALSGYILKSKSPSCGMERVKVYGTGGGSRPGRGIYAAAFMAARPDLPVEEEGRLGDPGLRANFVERVFAYHRWQQLARSGVTARRLVEFHTAHKLTLMAHGERQDPLGRLVARAGRTDPRALGETYLHRFMAILARPATRARHANVLLHVLGYLRRALDAEDRRELRELIEQYRTSALPLSVPIALLRHHFRRHPDPWIARQVYLYPDPRELALRDA